MSRLWKTQIHKLVPVRLSEKLSLVLGRIYDLLGDETSSTKRVQQFLLAEVVPESRRLWHTTYVERCGSG